LDDAVDVDVVVVVVDGLAWMLMAEKLAGG